MLQRERPQGVRLGIEVEADALLSTSGMQAYSIVLIPEEAAPQFRDDVAPRNGMMPPPDSEMIAPPITE